MTMEKQVVFVAQDGRMVLGVYSTKETAIAACEEWADNDAEFTTPWHRYDGKWERGFRRPDSGRSTLYVTECEVE